MTTLVHRTPRLLFLHSNVRSYRVPIFAALHERYPTRFLFLYGEHWASQFPAAQRWTYQGIRQYPMVGYTSDFAPGVIPELLRSSTYDVIIASGLASFGTHVAFPIARALRKPFILWSEDWVWSEARWPRRAMPYLRTIVRGADACIAASTKTRAFLIRWGADPTRVFHAPNAAPDLSATPIDPTAVEELRCRVNPDRKIVIAYFGRVVRYKALDTLIAAFAKLERERDDLLLLLLGDGPFAPACRRLLDELGVRRYHWPVPAPRPEGSYEPVNPDEIQRHFRLVDCFVLPGRFCMTDHVPCESWGFTINEALSLGIPTVSTASVAAAHDLLDSEDIAVPDDVGSLTAVLRRTLAGDLRATGARQCERLHAVATYNRMVDGFVRAIMAADEGRRR